MIETTLRCRTNMGLPARFLVLDDRGDAGVVLLDTGVGSDCEEWPVYWMGTHNVYRLAEGEALDSDCDSYAGYGEWVTGELEREKEWVEDNEA